MKKKILTKEALMALTAKAAEANAGVDIDPVIPEVKETEANEGTQEVEAAAEGTPDVQVDAVDIEAVKAEVAASFEEKITALEAEYAEKLATATAGIEAAEVAKDKFKEIVAGYVGTMRTALFLAEVDLTAMSDDSLLAEHDSVVQTFEKSLPVGGVVPKAEAEVKKEKFTNKDIGAVKALGF